MTSNESAEIFSSKRIGFGAASLALVTSFLWGGNQVFIKIGLQGMPPQAMAALRFSIGLIVVVVAAFVAKESVRVYPGEWRHLFGLAILFLTQISLLNQGVFYTTASRASVTIAAHPFFLALFCHFFVPGDRLSLQKVVGSLLAFIGIVIIFFDSLSLENTNYLLGDIMILVSAILLGLRQTVMKRMVHEFHPYKVLFWQSLLSLPIFIAFSAFFEADAVYKFNSAVIVAVLYQGIVVAGLCFITWVFLMRSHSASQLGVFAFTTPIAGVILSSVLVGDELQLVLLVSMVLVAAGIAVVARADR